MEKTESRYLRQEIIPLMGITGQKKLAKSKITIIGLGALGTVTSDLLARAGVGHITLIDRDIIELNNLQRQLLYDENDIGKPKAIVAYEKLSKINSEISIKSHATDLNFENISLLKKTDIVLDCTDNLETRFLINDFCKKNRIPWIYAAAIRWTGTIYNILPNGPCLKCILGNARSEETCETAGIINSVSAAVSAIQANEAIKILLNLPHEKDMLRFNLQTNNLMKIKIQKNKSCPTCRGEYEYLNGKKGSKIIKLCGKNQYQISGKITPSRFNHIKKQLSKLGKILDYGQCIHFKNITLFRDGRALINAKNEAEAKSLYSRFVGN